jgi:hypothetical protein
MSGYDPDEDGELPFGCFSVFAIVFSVLAFIFLVLKYLNIAINQP